MRNVPGFKEFYCIFDVISELLSLDISTGTPNLEKKNLQKYLINPREPAVKRICKHDL